MPQAKRCKDFTETVGVGGHLDRPQYRDRWTSHLRQLMIDSGIKYYRDTIPDAVDRDKCIDLYNVAGIRVNYLLWRSDAGGNDNLLGVQNQLTHAQTFGNALYAVEGLNESDLAPGLGYGTSAFYEGQGFPNGTRLQTQHLFDTARSRSFFNGKPVFSFSLGSAYAKSHSGIAGTEPPYLEFANVDKMDYYNMHTYAYQNRIPEHSDDIGMYINRANVVAPNKPRVITEIGYNTALLVRNSGLGIYTASERCQQKHMGRMLFNHFNLGFHQIYIHELLDGGINTSGADDEVEKGYGIVRFDGTPKPAYHVIKNIQTILNDTSATARTFTPGNLNYTISGDQTDLRQCLLQKQDGTYLLALWRAWVVYDWNSQQDLNNSTPAVTVTIPSSVAEVAVYQPSFSANKIASATNTNTATLGVGDEVMIVSLGAPTGGTVTTPPPPTNTTNPIRYSIQENKVYQMQYNGVDEDVSVLYLEFTGTGYGTPCYYIDDSLTKYHVPINNIIGVQEIVGRAAISVAPQMTQTGNVKILRQGTRYTFTLTNPAQTISGLFEYGNFRLSTYSAATFDLLLDFATGTKEVAVNRITNIAVEGSAPPPNTVVNTYRLEEGKVYQIQYTNNQ